MVQKNWIRGILCLLLMFFMVSVNSKPVIAAEAGELVDVPVNLEWVTTEDESKLPEKVTVGLYMDGELEAIKTVVLSKENGYKAVFEDVSLGGTYWVAVLDLPDNYNDYSYPEAYFGISERPTHLESLKEGFDITCREMISIEMEAEWYVTEDELIPECEDFTVYAAPNPVALGEFAYGKLEPIENDEYLWRGILEIPYMTEEETEYIYIVESWNEASERPDLHATGIWIIKSGDGLRAEVSKIGGMLSIALTPEELLNTSKVTFRNEGNWNANPPVDVRFLWNGSLQKQKVICLKKSRLA